MSTGNIGLDALADAIAERVIARIQAGQPDRLLTVEGAAEYLGRSVRAVRHLIAKGILPVVREGRSVHLDRRELDRWIELRAVAGGKVASMRRRTKGAGSLLLRGRTWWISYYVGGRPIPESSGSTDNLLKQRIGEIAAGRDVSRDRATINDLCALVITDYTVRKLRDATIVKWRYDPNTKLAIRSLLAARFGRSCRQGGRPAPAIRPSTSDSRR